MAKKAKMPTDVNQRGASIVALATGQAEPEPEKDPAAVERGRKGGKKGGTARANKLTPEQRSALARNAALARWES